MNRIALAALALALATAPVASFADSGSGGMNGGSMGSSSMSGSSMSHDSMSHGMMMTPGPKSMKHDVMKLGMLPESLQGEPVVVRIHADWCPACTATRATYDSVQKTFAGKAHFVTFDVTNATTAASAAATAKKLGLEKLFDADKTAASTVAVVNPRTGSVAYSLYNDNTAADYAQAIEAVAAQLHGM